MHLCILRAPPIQARNACVSTGLVFVTNSRRKEFTFEEKSPEEGGTGVSYIEDVFIVALVTYVGSLLE